MRDCDIDRVCLHGCTGSIGNRCTGERYVQAKGSVYKFPDGTPGSPELVTVIDDTTYANMDNVMVADEHGKGWCIDSFCLSYDYTPVSVTFRKV